MKESIELHNLYLNLKLLYEQLNKEKFQKFNRHLPFEELLFDRWDRAKIMGFDDNVSVYHSCLVFGNVKVGKNTWVGPNTILDGS